MNALKLVPFVALAAVAACSEGDVDSDDGGAAILSFAELEAAELRIVNEITTAGATPVGNIPPSGSSTYNGTVSLLLQDGSGDGVIGQATLTSDFTNNAVTGGASNFYDLDGNQTAGNLTVGSGSFERTLGTVTAEMNGNVTFTTAGATDVATNMAGNFSGPDAEYLSGVLLGTATPSGQTGIAVLGGIYTEQ